MERLLWQLRRSTGDFVRCGYHCAHPAAHVVFVIDGASERIREHHSTEADARDEAGHLFAYFLDTRCGEVTYCDPRLT